MKPGTRSSTKTQGGTSASGSQTNSPLSNRREDLALKVEAAVKQCLQDKATVDNLATVLTEKVVNTVFDAVKLLVTEEIAKLKDEFSNKLDELQQYQRRNAVRIFGIPERADENTDKLVVDLVKEKLNYALPASAICRSHRVGPKRGDKARPIIVKFISYRFRSEVFWRKKNLKDTGITISEDLTAARFQLLHVAMSRFGKSNVWSQDGRINFINQGVRGSVTTLYDLPLPPKTPQTAQMNRKEEPDPTQKLPAAATFRQ